MELSTLTNIEHLQRLCRSFSDMYGVTTAILNLEGDILVAAGWKAACTEFHRMNPVTAARCRESDTTLASNLSAGQEYNVYRCRNGLVDVAVPIKIRGQHIANLFTGQFFFDPPDHEEFRHQAREVGFDEALYLHAIDDVPVFTEQKIKLMMRFLRQLAELIGELGQANLQLKQQKAEIEKQALHDALTGLPNRYYLTEKIDEEIARFRRNPQRFACLFIDLDNFKHVNDSLGHEAGDRVLRDAAERIKSAVREYDLVARFGGDEFVVIATGLADKAVAGRVAEDIIKTLTTPFILDESAFDLSASVGIAIYPEDSRNASELMRAADAAMYAAKHAGKGCFRFV